MWFSTTNVYCLLMSKNIGLSCRSFSYFLILDVQFAPFTTLIYDILSLWHTTFIIAYILDTCTNASIQEWGCCAKVGIEICGYQNIYCCIFCFLEKSCLYFHHDVYHLATLPILFSQKNAACEHPSVHGVYISALAGDHNTMVWRVQVCLW